MKLLKYLLFIILIAFVGVSIYFGTQDGNFSVKKTRLIQAPVEIIYNKVNDFTIWKSIKNQYDTNLILGDTTSGIGAFYAWENSRYGKGELKTSMAVPNKSILHQMGLWKTSAERGYQAEWLFEPAEGGKATQVKWKAHGNLNLFSKMYFSLKGIDIVQTLEDIYSEKLQRLDSLAVAEMNQYSIIINGLTQYNGGFYLYKTVTGRQSELASNISETRLAIEDYMNDNNLIPQGSFFVLYHQWSQNLQTGTFSVGIPTRENIAVSQESEIQSGFLPVITCLKLTLKGDYKYLPQAWSMGYQRIEDNDWEIASGAPALEWYLTGSEDSINPADWLTEIFIPLDERSLGYNKPTEP